MTRPALALWLSLLAACAAPANFAGDELGPPPGGTLVSTGSGTRLWTQMLTQQVAWRAAIGDSLPYGVTLTGFGAHATGALLTVASPDGSWLLPTRQPLASLSGTFLLRNLTAWDVADFTLWAWGTNGAKVSRDSTQIASWRVTRTPGAPPGGGIDSGGTIALRLWPNPATVTVGQSLQFCAVLLDASFTWRLAEGSDPIICAPALLDPRFQNARVLLPQAARPDPVRGLAFGSWTIAPTSFRKIATR